MTITYFVSAMTLWLAVDTLFGWTPMIWYLCLVLIVPLALYLIWREGG